MILGISFITTYAKEHANDPYIRTKKGKEINKYLEGLKNYLKDFGNFEEKSHQELILWEDYLIYSVIFNLNTKIIKEYEQFF